MSADLVEKVARAWASMDGKSDRFDACKADPAIEDVEGYCLGYLADADELLERSGVTAAIAALTADNAALRAKAEKLAEALRPFDEKCTTLRSVPDDWKITAVDMGSHLRQVDLTAGDFKRARAALTEWGTP